MNYKKYSQWTKIYSQQTKIYSQSMKYFRKVFVQQKTRYFNIHLHEPDRV